ncbi:hypothetical protein BGX34_007834 [Mortierella sp. NVP85]|nr:hypothetical protein BGX34_007834 [Mortierella sp. NVP85]
MQIENSLCDYDAVEVVNQEMRTQLTSLVQQKFFRFYKMFQPFKRCQLKDQDFCQVEDEAISEGVYVDLMENPERFTGYSGPSAAKVWDAIYNENCFNVAQKMQMESNCKQCSLDRQANEELLAKKLKAAGRRGVSLARNPLNTAEGIHPFKDAPAAAAAAKDTASSNDRGALASDSGVSPQPLGVLTAGAVHEEVCLEKRVFYRMISGLHASISIHICDEYFNQTSGTWGPNLECFVSRVGTHPDRLENIYFDYAILVRAVTKLSGYLKNYEFCTGNPEEDAKVKAMVDRLIETSTRSPAIFDEKAMFVGPGAQALKMEFRDHFRNITKIMDCVGCEKCRLWGKVQTSGLGTALKVLFSYNDEHLNPIKHPNLLQRTEIVALFNTFNRLSESVQSITKFRELYMQQYGSHWTAAAATPVPSEFQQQHQEDVSDKETPVDSPKVQSFIASVLGECPGCRHPTKWLPLNAKMALRGAREWVLAKSLVVRDLILDAYHHPVFLFYGEQARTQKQSIREEPARRSNGHA